MTDTNAAPASSAATPDTPAGNGPVAPERKPIRFEPISSDTKPKRVYRRAFAIVDPRTRRLLLATIPLAIMASALEAFGLVLVLPYIELLTDDASTLDDLPSIVERFADFVGAETVDGALQVLGAAIVVLLLAKTAFTALFTYLQVGIVVRGETRLAVSLFDRYMHAPYQFHVHTNSAESIRNVKASISLVIKRVLVSWTHLITELTLVIVICASLVILSPLLAAVTVTFLGLVAVIYTRGLGRMARRLGVVDQRLSKDSLMVMQESLSGLKALRTLNREPSAVGEFRRVREEWEPVKHHTMFLATAPRFYLEFCVVLGLAAVVGTVFATNDTNEALGLVAVVVAATFRLLPSLNRILNSLNQTKLGAAAVESVELTIEHLDAFHANDGEGDQAEVAFTESIVFDDVGFTYHEADQPALQHIDLEVRRGQSVGLVGASGAGKSTMVDLLLGLLYATEGRIEVDGERITPGSVRSWRKQVGYVPQDIFLTDATLRQNIALGLTDDEIDDQRVNEAAAAAQLTDFVATLPAGLETKVGERGTRLSGGQRQRIGIARALYDNPEVLLLDEATSALDSATEASVSEVIDTLRGDTTMIIVAHRLSTVKNCDVIVHLSDGRVRSSGTFDELVKSDEKFAELVDLADVR